MKPAFVLAFVFTTGCFTTGCFMSSERASPCEPDLLEASGVIDVGTFELNREYQRIDATFTDASDSYRFEIARAEGPLSHRVRAMVSPIWSAMVRARVTCASGEPLHCGGASRLQDGACEAWAVDLANVIADCDGPAVLVLDVSPTGARAETCAYALDVAITP